MTAVVAVMTHGKLMYRCAACHERVPVTRDDGSPNIYAPEGEPADYRTNTICHDCASTEPTS